MHPIREKSDLEEEISSGEIKFSDHFIEDVIPDRDNITKGLVKEYLENKEDLISFSYKEDEHHRERYNLLFDKSSKYYLLIAVSLADGYINIITAFVTGKYRGKPEDLVERWG